jgi:hypothetical protein
LFRRLWCSAKSPALVGLADRGARGHEYVLSEPLAKMRPMQLCELRGLRIVLLSQPVDSLTPQQGLRAVGATVLSLSSFLPDRRAQAVVQMVTVDAVIALIVVLNPGAMQAFLGGVLDAWPGRHTAHRPDGCMRRIPSLSLLLMVYPAPRPCAAQPATSPMLA